VASAGYALIANNPIVLPENSYHTRSSRNRFDAHALDTLLELVPVDSIAIPQEMLRCRIPRESFNDLLTGPLSGRMLRAIEAHNPAPM